MENWLPVLVQIIVVVITSGGGWALLSEQRKKLRVETQDVAVDAMHKVNDELRDELERSRCRIHVLETAQKEGDARIDNLETMLTIVQRRLLALSVGVRLLTEQIRSLGHEPVWKDKEETTGE